MQTQHFVVQENHDGVCDKVVIQGTTDIERIKSSASMDLIKFEKYYYKLQQFEKSLKKKRNNSSHSLNRNAALKK